MGVCVYDETNWIFVVSIGFMAGRPPTPAENNTQPHLYYKTETHLQSNRSINYTPSIHSQIFPLLRGRQTFLVQRNEINQPSPFFYPLCTPPPTPVPSPQMNLIEMDERKSQLIAYSLLLYRNLDGILARLTTCQFRLRINIFHFTTPDTPRAQPLQPNKV